MQCYLHGYPSECQYKLQDLYNTLKESEECLTLEHIFKLLKNWSFEVPFSNLSKLIRLANSCSNQTNKNQLNELAFHQLLHNPTIQQIYKPKIGTPTTIQGLFQRMGEMIERQLIQEKLNDEQMSNKEKFNLMIQLMQVGSPRKEKSTIIDIVKSVRKPVEDEFAYLIKESKKVKRKAESMASLNEAQSSLFKDNNTTKFTKINGSQQINNLSNSTTRIRRLHYKMMMQMDELRYDANVQKLTNLIKSSQGHFSIRLPQI